MGFKVIETESVRKSQKGRSNTAKKRAEERLSSHATDMDIARAEIALLRAMTRIEILK